MNKIVNRYYKIKTSPNRIKYYARSMVIASFIAIGISLFVYGFGPFVLCVIATFCAANSVLIAFFGS